MGYFFTVITIVAFILIFAIQYEKQVYEECCDWGDFWIIYFVGVLYSSGLIVAGFIYDFF